MSWTAGMFILVAAAVGIGGVAIISQICVYPDIKCDPWSLKRGETADAIEAKCGKTSHTSGETKIKARYPTMGDTPYSPYRGAGDFTWHYGNPSGDHVNLYFSNGVLDDVQIIGGKS